MNVKTKILIGIFSVILLLNNVLIAKQLSLKSPDGKIEINIDVNNSITYSVLYKDKQIILPSPVSMNLEKFGQLG